MGKGAPLGSSLGGSYKGVCGQGVGSKAARQKGFPQITWCKEEFAEQPTLTNSPQIGRDHIKSQRT
ncbi:hypothetical protein CR513_48549, partial [Mucuna pruriens]